MLTPEAKTTSSGNPDNVLADTVSGANDSIIRSIARVVKNHSQQTVIIRFGHEMDIPGNYPWAKGDDNAPEFIKAYQHFVDVFRDEGVSNVKWLWSPAGNKNSPLYYPGDDYVDYVGMTLLESPDWDKQAGLPSRKFEDLFTEKYQILNEFQKPIVIAELGVAGDAAFKKEWLKDAFSKFSNYPLLSGVVYFNAQNAPTPFSSLLPDWRIDPNDFPPTS